MGLLYLDSFLASIALHEAFASIALQTLFTSLADGFALYAGLVAVFALHVFIYKLRSLCFDDLASHVCFALQVLLASSACRLCSLRTENLYTRLNIDVRIPNISNI